MIAYPVAGAKAEIWALRKWALSLRNPQGLIKARFAFKWPGEAYEYASLLLHPTRNADERQSGAEIRPDMDHTGARVKPQVQLRANSNRPVSFPLLDQRTPQLRVASPYVQFLASTASPETKRLTMQSSLPFIKFPVFLSALACEALRRVQ